MKKLLLVTLVAVFIGGTATLASANLIQNGDFEDSSAVINGAEFTLGSSNTGEWYALSPWSTAGGGPSGSFYYFDHTGGTGGDQRAFQPVDTSGMGLTGQEITLNFDYIYETGNWDIQNMGVALVGLSGDNVKYVAFSGTGYAGWRADWAWLGEEGTRTVLGSSSLLPTSGWGSSTLTAVVDQNYDVLIAVFSSSAWDLKGDNLGLRGIDNVSMRAPVPEPATILLLGAGLLGLAGLRRKFKR